MDKRKHVVLITGSGGLIGSAVVHKLSRRYTVVGFDRPEAPQPRGAAECVSVDLASAESLQHALQTVREQYGSSLAAVLHLAAYHEVGDNCDPRSAAVASWSTECLLDALQSFDVEQFLFLSTVLVHSPCQPGQAINEDWPLRPRCADVDWAARTEELVRSQHGDIPVVLLRAAGVYDDRAHSTCLAHQIQRIYERRLSGHLYPGDTDHGHPFVHLADLAEALQLCVERRFRLPLELPLLIGEPETVSYDQLQRTIGRLIHHEVWETYQIPKTLAKTGAWVEEKILHREDPSLAPMTVDLADDHYALDISRARSLLGWRPSHALCDTVPAMVDALCSNPSRWYEINHLPLPPKGRLKPRSTEFTQSIRPVRQPERAMRDRRQGIL